MDPIVTPTTFMAAWIIVLGLVALLIQAVANQPTWSPAAKRTVTVVVAVLLGTIYAVANGLITEVSTNVQAAVTHWFIVVAGIIAVGQAVYRFLKPGLDKLEAATSPGGAEVYPDTTTPVIQVKPDNTRTDSNAPADWKLADEPPGEEQH